MSTRSTDYKAAAAAALNSERHILHGPKRLVVAPASIVCIRGLRQGISPECRRVSFMFDLGSFGHRADKRWEFPVLGMKSCRAMKTRSFAGARIRRGRSRSVEVGAAGCRLEGWRAGGQAQAVQNFPRGVGRMDGGQNPEAALAIGAFQNVQFKHSGHQDSPRIVPAPACGAALTFPYQADGGGRRGYDGGAPFCCRRHHSVKANQVRARRRKQRKTPH